MYTTIWAVCLSVWAMMIDTLMLIRWQYVINVLTNCAQHNQRNTAEKWVRADANLEQVSSIWREQERKKSHRKKTKKKGWEKQRQRTREILLDIVKTIQSHTCASIHPPTQGKIYKSWRPTVMCQQISIGSIQIKAQILNELLITIDQYARYILITPSLKSFNADIFDRDFGNALKSAVSIVCVCVSVRCFCFTRVVLYTMPLFAECLSKAKRKHARKRK